MSAFSLVEMVLLSKENLGIGETEVLDCENGAFCDDDFEEAAPWRGKRLRIRVQILDQLTA